MGEGRRVEGARTDPADPREAISDDRLGYIKRRLSYSGKTERWATADVTALVARLEAAEAALDRLVAGSGPSPEPDSRQ